MAQAELSLLGYGRKFLNFNHRWLKYASEAAYPYYLLHQIVIMVLGFYVVQWQAAVLNPCGAPGRSSPPDHTPLAKRPWGSPAVPGA